MCQLEKIPLIWLLLNILKPNFATCDWFWTDGSHITEESLQCGTIKNRLKTSSKLTSPFPLALPWNNSALYECIPLPESHSVD